MNRERFAAYLAEHCATVGEVAAVLDISVQELEARVEGRAAFTPGERGALVKWLGSAAEGAVIRELLEPRGRHTTAELAEGLRCCWSDKGCKACPLCGAPGECAQLLDLEAAERLEELEQKVRELTDATEGICQRETNELVRLAGEAATALERGLAGVNEELFARMQQHQQVLTELGRGSVIHAEPVQEKGWRIDWIQVEGLRVYGEVPEC